MADEPKADAPKTDEAEEAKVCSFCHKGVGEGDQPIKKLVTGTDPNGVPVAICDLCLEMLWLTRGNTGSAQGPTRH